MKVCLSGRRGGTQHQSGGAASGSRVWIRTPQSETLGAREAVRIFDRTSGAPECDHARSETESRNYQNLSDMGYGVSLSAPSPLPPSVSPLSRPLFRIVMIGW